MSLLRNVEISSPYIAFEIGRMKFLESRVVCYAHLINPLVSEGTRLSCGYHLLSRIILYPMERICDSVQAVYFAAIADLVYTRAISLV